MIQRFSDFSLNNYNERYFLRKKKMKRSLITELLKHFYYLSTNPLALLTTFLSEAIRTNENFD